MKKEIIIRASTNLVSTERSQAPLTIVIDLRTPFCIFVVIMTASPAVTGSCRSMWWSGNRRRPLINEEIFLVARVKRDIGPTVDAYYAEREIQDSKQNVMTLIKVVCQIFDMVVECAAQWKQYGIDMTAEGLIGYRRPGQWADCKSPCFTCLTSPNRFTLESNISPGQIHTSRISPSVASSGKARLYIFNPRGGAVFSAIKTLQPPQHCIRKSSK